MERGTVIEIEKNNILVEAEPNVCCEGCAAGGSCAISKDARMRRLWMENGQQKAAPGDEIEFYIAEKAVVAASAFLYLFPAVMLIAGLIIGAILGDLLRLERDISSALFGGLLAVIAFVVIKAVSVKMKKRGLITPVMVGVVGRKGIK